MIDKIFNKTEYFPAFLAPMAGFTDAPFRLLCTRLGCDMSVSEMISAKAMVYRDKKTATLAKIEAGEAPVSIQLFGHEPEVMAEAACMVAEGSFEGCDFAAPPVAIDINMGCPVKKIVSSGDGSALMKTPELCGKLVEGAKKCGLPVTVKIRAGFTADTKNAVEVARICADAGAKAVCVHGRTREQMYAPGVDLDIIAAVRSALPKDVYVIGNGDVKDLKSARAMVEYTGCNGVMIGREALGNPWVFAEIASGGQNYYPPTPEDRLRTAADLIRCICEKNGEYNGVRESRGRAAHFIKGLRGAAEMRASLNSAETLSDVMNILDVNKLDV
jgi:nifR3 family TIM-barrel protein